jgi:glycosyltransferase involved in cell wall biosynthesis
MAGTVLYITHDGLTDHIGRSQIVPYLRGLAARGHRIQVLSVEKPGRDDALATMRVALGAAGIGWAHIAYSKRFGFVSLLWEWWRLRRVARQLMGKHGVRLLHCRCFPGMLVGEGLARRAGIPVLFDFRDFWPDTRIETRRFTLPYRAIKLMERGLVRRANHIVCLTARARDILIQRHLQDRADAAAGFTVIPCCADFDLFDPTAVNAAARQRARERAHLGSEGAVLLYLGSLGADYLLDAMFALYRELLALRPDAWFLLVTNNPSGEIEGRARAAGVSAERVRTISAAREEVPSFVALADLSVVFIRQSLGKAGCSPTKLAESLALGVPVIGNAGVGDLVQLLDLARNGSVAVRDFEPATLRAALEDVLTVRASGRVDVRANSQDLSLEVGVARYAAVYDSLLTRGGEGRSRC